VNFFAMASSYHDKILIVEVYSRSKILLILFFALASVHAEASPQTLLIAGNPNDEAFYDQSLSVLNFSSENHSEVTTAVGWGARMRSEAWPDSTLKLPLWSAFSEKQLRPAMGPGDIEASLIEVAKKLKPGEPFNLVISDHGFGPISASEPLTGGIVLGTSNPAAVTKDAGTAPAVELMTDARLVALLEKYVPKSCPIHLVGAQCYSGGASFDFLSIK
jgi:hypothetical protein